MKKSKPEVVDALREIADLLEITDANMFEVMAHRNASRSLDEWEGDLEAAVAGATLTDIPAVGKGIAQVITDLAKTGQSPVLNQVRSAVPAKLPPLLRISGLGPKRVRALWQELGVESPEDLRQAAEQGTLLQLKGFGKKMVERILAGLDRLDKPRTRRSEAQQKVAVETAAPSTGQMWAGTSGFSYPQWKGSFYPADAKTADLLSLYAQQLSAVEINNTFYRFPSSKVIQQWVEQTPAHFRFALKAHRRITHLLRLSAESADTITDFVGRCGELGSRLGCILFQLPPNFAREDSRLKLLLDTLPQGPRYAVEFRHESWFDEGVLAQLTDRNIACVSGDDDKTPPRRVATADFLYVRLRREAYSEAELTAWDRWFAEHTAQRQDVWAFLKHDEAGAAPQAVLSRWLPSGFAAQAQLKRQLAKPPKAKPTKRRRKSG